MVLKTSCSNEIINAEKFVDRLLHEGTKIGCNPDKQNKIPPFYDEQLFKKGQKFFHKHIFGMFFAKMLGLLAVLSIPPVLKILMLTGKTSSYYNAYNRYVSTVFHMIVWYRDDFIPGSKLWKSLSQVNNKHNAASKLGCSAGYGRITQKDMALTQFGFMGFQLCRTEKVGIHGATEEEFEAFVHMWRVISYTMGMEDRFNICGGSVEETRKICNILVDKCFYVNVSKKDPDYLKMSDYLVGGMWSMNPFLMFKILMNYLYSLLKKSDDNNNKSSPLPASYLKLNVFQNAFYKYLHMTMLMVKFDFIRRFINSVHHLNLWFVRNWPILAYYSFGRNSDSIVQLKL